MTIVMVIHLLHKGALYISTPAVKRHTGNVITLLQSWIKERFWASKEKLKCN